MFKVISLIYLREEKEEFLEHSSVRIADTGENICLIIFFVYATLICTGVVGY